MLVRIICTLFVGLGLMPPLAYAEKRVALVIGNSAYKYTGELTNPRNDATDMGAALKELGFQVIDGFDLDKVAFEVKLREFAEALTGSDGGVFFYAGHGLQVSGQNYLVPIDAKAEGLESLGLEMIRANLVQSIMEDKTSTNVLFLDACRNNPLARNLARSMGTRSIEVGRGLAPAESGIGTLISYSTAPGTVALDGVGRNSPFAGALVKHIATNEELSRILISVRNDVMKVTQRQQVPWEHSALTGQFYFNPTALATEPKKEPIGSLPRPSFQTTAFDGTWQAVLNCPKSTGGLLGFTNQYDVLVENGTLRGEYGKPGNPDSRVLEGKIESSGAASFWERGWSGGGGAFSGLRDGTPFEYRFHGGFDATEGIAKRASGSRECAYTFTKRSQSRPAAPLSEASEVWGRAKDTTDAAVLEDFIARFKETFYADLARRRIDELKAMQSETRLQPQVERASPYSVVDGSGLVNVRSLIEKHGFPLPDFQIEQPNADVPASFRRFIGVWVSTDDNGGRKRKLMLICTRVEKDGKLDGYWLFTGYNAPPNQGTPGFFKVVGMITDNTMRFVGPNGALKFSPTKANRLDYSYFQAGGSTDARLFNPVWTLIDAEGAGVVVPPPGAGKTPLNSLPKGQFDGVWYLDRASKNCGAKSWRLNIIVHHGVVAGAITTGAVTGTISESGQFALQHPGATAGQPDGSTLHYKGSLQGSSGSGTFYQNPDCDGTFTLKQF